MKNPFWLFALCILMPTCLLDLYSMASYFPLCFHSFSQLANGNPVLLLDCWALSVTILHYSQHSERPASLWIGNMSRIFVCVFFSVRFEEHRVIFIITVEWIAIMWAPSQCWNQIDFTCCSLKKYVLAKHAIGSVKIWLAFLIKVIVIIVCCCCNYCSFFHYLNQKCNQKCGRAKVQSFLLL